MIASVNVRQTRITARCQSAERIALVNVRSASRVTAVTIGKQGVAGRDGEDQLINAIYLAHGDATPAIIETLDIDKIIRSVTLLVTEPFNGTGASVSIGIDGFPDLLIDGDEIDFAAISQYETNPGAELPEGTQIKAWITPGGGSSTGKCTILIEYAKA